MLMCRGQVWGTKKGEGVGTVGAPACRTLEVQKESTSSQFSQRQWEEENWGGGASIGNAEFGFVCAKVLLCRY